MSTCSSEEAMAALGYLRRSFTCYDLDDQAARSLTRTFMKFTSADVMRAIEDLKGVSSHWPTAAVVEQQVAKNRGKKPGGVRVVRKGLRFNEEFDENGNVVTIPESEFVPAEEVPVLVESLRDPESPLRAGDAMPVTSP